MAITVPYQPVPQVSPDQSGVPGLSVQSSPNAFGAQVAEATQHLGDVGQSAGNELFQRAQALQGLKNESDAREADTNYMIAAGKLHADYSTLEGKDAVDAAPKYFQDLKDARNQFRDGLAAPDAQKMFDATSLSTMSRSIFNGAGYAATENKKYNMGTLQAQSDISANNVSDNPNDEGLFSQKLQQAQDNAKQLAALKGYSAGSPEEQLTIQTATSNLWKNRIVGLSRTAPFEASALLDKNKTAMTEDDYLKTDNVVRAQGRAVGSVNIANDVYTAGKGSDTVPPKPYAQMEQEVKDKATAMNPNDPVLQKDAVTAFHGLYNQEQYAQRQEQYTNTQTVQAAINKGGVQNIQQLRQDPNVAAAIDALPPSMQNQVPGQINRYNAAATKDTDQLNYTRLTGLMNNDTLKFLDTDLTKEQLSQSDMRHFQALQQKFKQQPQGDPQVSRAVNWVKQARGSDLENLGIAKPTANNVDDYNHFTGAMSQALDLWQQDHGKPASYQDVVNDIAPQILSQRTVKGYIFNSTTPLYNLIPSSKDADDIKAGVVAGGGREPTDEEVQRAWVRKQLIELHQGGKPNGG